MYNLEKVCQLFLLLFFFSFNLSAQTVTTVSGYPVIDLSALNPLGAVLSSADAASRRTLMNQQTPSNSAYLGVGQLVSDHNGTWNAEMSIKFQVMRSDHAVGFTDWTSAYNSCKNYDGEGGVAGQWRLPTQNELHMIWILHPQLIGKGKVRAFDDYYYWSATELGAGYAWFVDFRDGYVAYDSKTNSYFVRCVRDL